MLNGTIAATHEQQGISKVQQHRASKACASLAEVALHDENSEVSHKCRELIDLLIGRYSQSALSPRDGLENGHR